MCSGPHLNKQHVVPGRADGFCAPTQQKERETEHFIPLVLRGPKTFRGLPDFPTNAQMHPRGEAGSVGLSDVPLSGADVQTLHPQTPPLCPPSLWARLGNLQELTWSQTSGQWPGDAGLHPRGVSSCDGPSAPRPGLNEWSGRFKTAHKLSYLKALFQVVLCSLIEAGRYVSS